MSDQAKNARSIFLEILEKGSRQQWAELLDQACGDDQQLRMQVQRLLQAHNDLGSFMNQPAADQSFTIESSILNGPGTQIGQFKLLQQIGEGGFGVVYLAEQMRPVKRRVACGRDYWPGRSARRVDSIRRPVPPCPHKDRPRA